MARARNMTIKEIGSITTGKDALTIYGEVASGPAGTIGRTAGYHLTENSLAFILVTLAGIPEYRYVFRAIANEIDLRLITAGNRVTSPETRRHMELSSFDSMQALGLVIKNALRNYRADAQGDTDDESAHMPNDD